MPFDVGQYAKDAAAQGAAQGSVEAMIKYKKSLGRTEAPTAAGERAVSKDTINVGIANDFFREGLRFYDKFFDFIKRGGGAQNLVAPPKTTTTIEMRSKGRASLAQSDGISKDTQRRIHRDIRRSDREIT